HVRRRAPGDESPAGGQLQRRDRNRVRYAESVDFLIDDEHALAGLRAALDGRVEERAAQPHFGAGAQQAAARLTGHRPEALLSREPRVAELAEAGKSDRRGSAVR